MRKEPGLKRKQEGIAMLEFMFSAPLLIVLMFAVTELGWAFHQYHTMTRATRDGARHMASGAMVGSVGIIYLDSTLVQQTGNLVVYGNVNGTGTPLLPNWTSAGVSVTSPNPTHIRVSANYDYVPLVGAIPTFYGGDPLSLSFQMQSTVEMRAL
ncbi:TadE/TadG family type IV pilus assembly protein [Marinobacter sp. F4206]|uniref:TadE/TadG family type IV pilus assembly protein n=1 Tax=Marinobacter sp. F4206 TaxID=2861777 RepID=UPI001C5F5CF3|nr:TadE/TadG family type IV pilus assembly protein [Marinobacter sp. F4206]MBW4933061.1 pilus assembly protein [Marinobacter sp. F4206]